MKTPFPILRLLAIWLTVLSLTSPTQAQSGNAATRALPAQYTPGVPFTVTVTVTPASTVSAYGVEDQHSPAWTNVGNVNENGKFDPSSGTVRWIFFDKNPRVLTYQITPASDASACLGFAGSANFDGVGITLGGSNVICPPCIPPVISQPPQGTNANIGDLVTFKVSALGTLPLRYQWYHNGTASSDAHFVGSTTASLAIPGVQASDAGTYSIVVTNPCGSATASVTLSVCLPSSATRSMPDPCYANVPFTVTIAVTLACGVTSYTVQEQPPPGWNPSNITEGGVFDQTSKMIGWRFTDGQPRNLTYQVTPPTSASGIANFAGTTSFGLVGGRSATTVTNGTLPKIITQPQAQTVLEGASATFSVSATGIPPLAYQWQFNGANLVGQTNSIFILNNVTTSQEGNYTVVVSNAVGPTTSQVASLTVNVPPLIAQGPQSQTVAPGQSASFTVTATGKPPPTYQWKLSQNAGRAWTNLTDDSTYSGTTSPKLTVSGVAELMNNYWFRVVASNGAGPDAESDPAILTVRTGPVITVQPTNQVVLAGTNATFTVVATGIPAPAYHWQVSTDGRISWNGVADGPTYQGTTSNTLTVISATRAVEGYWFRAVVSNSSGAVTSQEVSLTVKERLTITLQPGDQTVLAGTNVTLNVGAVGTPPLGYQWQFNGASLTNETNTTLVLNNVATKQAGNYSVLVSNVVNVVTTRVAVLKVDAPVAIVQQPQNQRAVVGSNAALTVIASGMPLPSYQWMFNATNILIGATNAMLQLSNVSTNDAGAYSVVISNITISNTINVVTSDTATVTVLVLPRITKQPQSQTNFVGSNVKFTVEASAPADSGPLSYLWQRNGVNQISDFTSSNLWVTFVQPSHAGAYTVIVSNYAGSVTSAPAILVVIRPIVITQQPQSQAIVAGMDVTFSVGVAGGTPPYNFQWFFNITNILVWATDAALTLTNVSLRQAGTYNVKVSDSLTSTLSAPALLTVFPPIVNAKLTGTSFAASAATQVGFSYTFEYKTSLSDPTWTLVQTLAGTGGMVLLRDDVATGSSRFYRLRVQYPNP